MQPARDWGSQMPPTASPQRRQTHVAVTILGVSEVCRCPEKSREYLHSSSSAIHWVTTKPLVSTVVRTHGEGEIIVSLPKIGYPMSTFLQANDRRQPFKLLRVDFPT